MLLSKDEWTELMLSLECRRSDIRIFFETADLMTYSGRLTLTAMLNKESSKQLDAHFCEGSIEACSDEISDWTGRASTTNHSFPGSNAWSSEQDAIMSLPSYLTGLAEALVCELIGASSPRIALPSEASAYMMANVERLLVASLYLAMHSTLYAAAIEISNFYRGIGQGDVRLLALYDWSSSYMSPVPYPSSWSGNR